MPHAIRAYPDIPLVVTRLIGEVSTADLRAIYEKLDGTPGYSSTYPELADFRAAAGFGFGHEELARLARVVDLKHRGARIRTAILARPGLGFGMARTYQSYASNEQTEVVAVFQDTQAALEWSGAPGVDPAILDFGPD